MAHVPNKASGESFLILVIRNRQAKNSLAHPHVLREPILFVRPRPSEIMGDHRQLSQLAAAAM
jgi:hypothetical protein